MLQEKIYSTGVNHDNHDLRLSYFYNTDHWFDLFCKFPTYRTSNSGKNGCVSSWLSQPGVNLSFLSKFAHFRKLDRFNIVNYFPRGIKRKEER